jgi:hypothetical protein
MRTFNCKTKTLVLKDSKIEGFEFDEDSSEPSIIVYMISRNSFTLHTSEGKTNQISLDEYNRIKESIVNPKYKVSTNLTQQ